jgi:biopolymer transport protein ExbD
VVFIFCFTACTIFKTAIEVTVPEATTKSKIAFNSNRDGNSEIYIMNIDGSEQVNFTNNPAIDVNPSFSPIP